MKKIILGLALLFVPLLASASIDTNLYYGVHNKPEVQELQEFLIEKGFLSGSATGNFYSLTLKAVKDYQESEGIKRTGYVGVLTRKAINDTLTADLQASNDNSVEDTGSLPPQNNNQISQPTTMENQPSTTANPNPSPTQTTAPVATAPVPAVTLQIVSPLNGKGLGRDYVASPVINDESNYIDIGLIVTNPDGTINQTATVTVTTSDAGQNKELVGTGTFWGNPHNVYYYPFEYQFKIAGDHVITFTCLGVSQSITLTAK